MYNLPGDFSTARENKTLLLSGHTNRNTVRKRVKACFFRINFILPFPGKDILKEKNKIKLVESEYPLINTNQ